MRFSRPTRLPLACESKGEHRRSDHSIPQRRRSRSEAIGGEKNKLKPEMASYIMNLYQFSLGIAPNTEIAAKTEETWMRTKEQLKGEPIDWSKTIDRSYLDRDMAMQLAVLGEKVRNLKAGRTIVTVKADGAIERAATPITANPDAGCANFA